MDALAGLDQVAYVRFASVYKNFRETPRTSSEFIDQLGAERRLTAPPIGGRRLTPLADRPSGTIATT